MAPVRCPYRTGESRPSKQTSWKRPQKLKNLTLPLPPRVRTRGGRHVNIFQHPTLPSHQLPYPSQPDNIFRQALCPGPTGGAGPGQRMVSKCYVGVNSRLALLWN